MPGRITKSEILKTNLYPEEESDVKSKDENFLNFISFLSEVSIAGARYTANHNAHTIRRLIWATFIVFGLGFASYQIYQQIRYYLGLPVTVKINIEEVEELTFPTVTVCSNNMINKSSNFEMDPSGDLSWTMKEAYPPIPMDTKRDIGRITEIYQIWNGVDWGEIYTRMFPDTRKLLLSCSFDGNACNSTHIREVISAVGPCLQFNYDGKLSSAVSGNVNGLRLVMSADADNYNLQLAPGVGYTVFVHHQTEFKENNKNLVDVNHHSQMIVSSEKIGKLPHPYGSCSEEDDYAQSVCRDACYERHVVNLCNCRWLGFRSVNTSVRLCTPLETATCVTAADKFYFVEKIETTQCDCPSQCSQQLYPYTSSTTSLSKFAVDWLKENYQGDIEMTEDYIRENIVVLDVYFEKLQVTEMITQPAYSLLSLLCDIGGALGLILGSTVLTVFEILDFCIVTSLKSVSKVKIRPGTTRVNRLI